MATVKRIDEINPTDWYVFLNLFNSFVGVIG